ncbi:MAG: MATE family efflux transporter [Candidatus Gracilibacteria bacterium]|nr:MATE family efflux transporter [Candidatus Gracilibacteria bacterium]
MKQKINHLLEGSVMKSIIMISVPIILANTLQSVYQLIDTFWVGRLGEEAVAAVSLSFPILFLLTSFAMGLAMAGSILIAQYNGRGDTEHVCLATGQTFALVSSVAIFLSIIGYLSSEFLLSFLTDDPTVLKDATSYLQISFIAMWGMFSFVIFQSAMRGVGRVKLPMIIVLITVILNFFLDPIFMFGWKFIPPMGVSGVALATLATEYLSALIGIIILASGKFHIKLRLQDLWLRASWVKRLSKLGLPSSLEHSSRSIGMVIMTFIVAMFGTSIVAAFGIGGRVLMFIIIPGIGLSIATSTLVGNNLGAKQHQRTLEIARAGMKIGFWTLTAVGILLFLTATQITTFFIPDEPEVIAIASRFIRIMALSFGFIGVQMALTGTLRAAGKTSLAMSLAMFQTACLVIFSLVLAKFFQLGELGIWISYPVANFLAMLLTYYFYRKKDWLQKELV